MKKYIFNGSIFQKFWVSVRLLFKRRLKLEDVGDDDRIFGYNPVYRTNAVQQRFDAFDMQNNRPTAFINQLVAIVNQTHPPTLINDHQGHIVPQNLLIRAMTPVVAGLSACNNMAEVNAYVAANNVHYPWLQMVLNYGGGVNPPISLFDFNEEGEDRVRSFFSVIIWNPINICRAPDDARRGGYPGNNIDALVVAYLQAHPVGVNAAWLASLAALPAAPTDVQINSYITACCATLAGQVNHGDGYYQFNWQFEANGNLQPA